MVFIQIDENDLKSNNLKSLKLRKDKFKLELIKSFEILGYIFITILYLQNISFVRFIIRLIIQGLINNPFPEKISISNNIKKKIIKSLFYTVIIINFLFTILDLIVGIPKIELELGLNNGNLNYLFGGMSVEIIGELKPNSRLNYLFYNLIIFFDQFCLIYLSSIINFEINSLEIEDEDIKILEIDGYTGQIKILSINPINIIKQVLNFEIEIDSENNDISTSELYNDFLENRFNSQSINF